MVTLIPLSVYTVKESIVFPAFFVLGIVFCFALVYVLGESIGLDTYLAAEAHLNMRCTFSDYMDIMALLEILYCPMNNRNGYYAMTIITVFSMIASLSLGVITAYTDIHFHKARNKHLLIFPYTSNQSTAISSRDTPLV